MSLRKRPLVYLITILLIFTLLIAIRKTSTNPLSWSSVALVPATAMEPLVTHIVLFKYRPGASPSDIEKVNAQMLALKEACTHPVTQRPYIKYISGGIDNSKEGLQGGMTHGFVLHFSSLEDRDYYVEKDPAHAAFKKAVAEVLEKPLVLDFTDGVFTPSAPVEPAT